ncbi:MAG TPA: ATP synthase F1 subunit epsilon [Candidatus Paceibacterota bacterium]
MKISIHSLEGTIYEGDAAQITLPSSDGEITVLKNHIPLITTLKSGSIRFSDQNIPIVGGFAEVTKDKVVVLAN